MSICCEVPLTLISPSANIYSHFFMCASLPHLQFRPAPYPFILLLSLCPSFSPALHYPFACYSHCTTSSYFFHFSLPLSNPYPVSFPFFCICTNLYFCLYWKLSTVSHESDGLVEVQTARERRRQDRRSMKKGVR